MSQLFQQIENTNFLLFQTSLEIAPTISITFSVVEQETMTYESCMKGKNGGRRGLKWTEANEHDSNGIVKQNVKEDTYNLLVFTPLTRFTLVQDLVNKVDWFRTE